MLDETALLAHLILFVWLASVLGSGLKILTLLRIGSLTLLSQLSLALGLGVGLCALATMWLGFVGLLSFPYLYGLLIAMLLIGWGSLRRWFLNAMAYCASRAVSREDAYIGVSIGALVLLGWGLALVPPVFFDTVVYGLGLPMQYLVQGKIVYFPSFHYSAMPQNAQMIYAFALGLGDIPLAQLVSLSVSWMVALTAAAIAGHIQRPARAYGFVLALGVPLTLFLGAHSGTDQFVALFVLSAIHAVLLWKDAPTTGRCVVGAIFIGLAVGTKYTGIYLVIPLLVLLLLARKPDRQWLHQLGLGCIVVICVAGPWYVRNAMNTSNPVYPAFYSLLGGSDWSEGSAAKVTGDVQHGAGSALTVEALIKLPWNLVVHSETFGAFGEAGILLWGILGFALYAMVRVASVRLLGLYCALVLPFWVATSMNLRYIYPVVIILYTLAAIGLQRFGERIERIALVPLVLAVVVATNMYLVVKTEESVFQPSRLWSGQQSRKAYIAQRVPYYPLAQYVAEHLDENAKILLVGESRLLYWQRSTIPSSAYDTAFIVPVIRDSRDAETAACELITQGMTHIVYNPVEAKRLRKLYDYFSWQSEEEQRRFDELRSYLDPVRVDQGVILFTIRAPETGCPSV